MSGHSDEQMYGAYEIVVDSGGKNRQTEAGACCLLGTSCHSHLIRKVHSIANFHNTRAGHKAPLVMMLASVLAMLAPSVGRADRGGFTLELSSGIGSFSSFQIEGDNVLEPAVTPLAVGIGGFVSRDVAILARASVVLFRYSPSGAKDDAESRLTPQLTRSVLLGTTLQWWLSDSWMVESGLGLALIGNGPVESRINRGLGIPTRIGWTLAERGNGAFSAVLEVFPSFYSRGEATVSSTVGIQWQWL